MCQSVDSSTLHLFCQSTVILLLLQSNPCSTFALTHNLTDPTHPTVQNPALWKSAFFPVRQALRQAACTTKVALTFILSSSSLAAFCWDSRRSLSWEQICGEKRKVVTVFPTAVTERASCAVHKLLCTGEVPPPSYKAVQYTSCFALARSHHLRTKLCSTRAALHWRGPHHLRIVCSGGGSQSFLVLQVEAFQTS